MFMFETKADVERMMRIINRFDTKTKFVDLDDFCKTFKILKVGVIK